MPYLDSSRFAKSMILAGVSILALPWLNLSAVAAEGPLAGKTIAYIQTFSNPYYDGTAQGVRLAAKSLGADTLVLVSKFDPAVERANVQDAITKKVAAVVLEPATAQSTASNLALLKEAGIPRRRSLWIFAVFDW